MRGRSLHYFVIDGHQVEQHLPEIWRLYHRVNDVINTTCSRSVGGAEDRINLILAYDEPGAQFAIEKNLDTYLYTEQASAASDPNYA